MAVKSSLLWILGLILCYCESQSNSMEVKMIKSPTAFRNAVELKCETSHADAGIFWMFQRVDQTIQFVLYVSARSKVTEGQIRGYSSSKDGNYYRLTIASFQKENQGIYYCIVHRNQMLIFSSGLPVFVPVTTTRPPTVPQRISTRSKELATKEPAACLNPTASGEDASTVFPCKLYIWAPLVGGCFILLISLVITLSVCCDSRRRRRRCRCKRPMNGANGALPLPR